jgi:hypothetical protein
MSEENELKLVKEIIRLREFMQSETSGISLVLEKVSALDDKVDLKFKALEELRKVMEENRDRRCQLHERDIDELKKEKEESKKQRWTYGGAIAIIVFLITLFGPKILEALSK